MRGFSVEVFPLVSNSSISESLREYPEKVFQMTNSSLSPLNPLLLHIIFPYLLLDKLQYLILYQRQSLKID